MCTNTDSSDWLTTVPARAGCNNKYISGDISMNSMKNALVALWREEEGLTMVEYCIAGGLVAAGAAVAFTNLGSAISKTINNLIGYMNIPAA